MSKTITMNLKDTIKEHERLVDTLKGKSKKKISAELKEQSKELKSYKKKAEKSDMTIMTPDGKIQRVKGKEPLIKDENLERWKLIKKNLDNAKSIIDLKEEQKNEDGPTDDGKSEGNDEQPSAQGEEQSQQLSQQSPEGADEAGADPSQEQEAQAPQE